LKIKLGMQEERFQNIKDLNTRDLKKQEIIFPRKKKKEKDKEKKRVVPVRKVEREWMEMREKERERERK